MPKLITAYDRDRFPSLSSWLGEQARNLVSHGIFFVAMSGTIWSLGHFHMFLHGGEKRWIHVLLVDHPFATAAAMYVVVGILKLLGIEPGREGGAASAPCVEDAPALVGRAFTIASGRSPDLSGAHGLLVRAHAGGSAEAAYALADWTARGIVVERDRAKANALYREAAAGGIPAAMHAVAVSAENGWDMPADAAAAYRGYLRAALLGCAEAAWDVARCLREGVGTQADPEAAAVWQEAARSRGDAASRWGRGVWPWEAAAGAAGLA